MDKDIIVKSQQELDNIPEDYNGRVYIEFGTPYNRAVINRRFMHPVEARDNSSVTARGDSSVVARDNSSVEAWGNSSVEAWDNSSVLAWGNSSVEAWDNSSVEAWGDSSVEAWGNSSVEAWDNSSVTAWSNSSVEARGNSSVEARDNSSVEAWDNSSVTARGDSSVVARDNSSVEAWGNSSVEAWDNSSVTAWSNSSVEARGNSSVEARDNSSVVAKANSQVLDASPYNSIEVSGNARIVYNPTDIQSYINHYDIESSDGKVKLYKTVHNRNGSYVSDYDPSFEYKIGEVAAADFLDTDPSRECGKGIHVAYKEWCVNYGREWRDLAIIEVECEADGIIVPTFGSGKVRVAKVKVLREVPLEECGLLGKILARRRKED